MSIVLKYATLSLPNVDWAKICFSLSLPTNSCLAMLGCHDLEGTRYGGSNGKEVFDFNVTVNRLKVFFIKFREYYEFLPSN